VRSPRPIHWGSHIINGALTLALVLIEHFEGLRLRPYICPAGVWSVGLGTTRYPDGMRVGPTDAPITRERAFEIAEYQLRNDYLPGVLATSGSALDTDGRCAAILDFSYNLGVSAYRGSTLRKRVDANDWDGARIELAKWIRGGGKVLPGLVKRRAAEAALI
jgi:lysozyme